MQLLLIQSFHEYNKNCKLWQFLNIWNTYTLIPISHVIYLGYFMTLTYIHNYLVTLTYIHKCQEQQILITNISEKKFALFKCRT